jgi:rare lipoprotein A (peptidoglycan hydrolase)
MRYALLVMLLAVPAVAHPRQETGVASWYGPGFAGKQTSSGEIFNPHKMTAAHNSLPLGSRVRVTNLVTHKSVIVKINDRGSFGHKYHRLIDLSPTAAHRLDIEKQGTARVRITVISVTHHHRHPRGDRHMVREQLSDERRQLLLILVTQAWVRIKDDPDMDCQSEECRDILRMLSGADVRLFVERA